MATSFWFFFVLVLLLVRIGQAPHTGARCLIAICRTAKSAPACDNIDHHWSVKSSPSKRCLIPIGLGHGLRELLPGFIHSVLVLLVGRMREILHLQVFRVTVTITVMVYQRWHHHIHLHHHLQHHCLHHWKNLYIIYWKLSKNVKTCKKLSKLSKCWSGHVSPSLWSNVSKVTSL